MNTVASHRVSRAWLRIVTCGSTAAAAATLAGLPGLLATDNEAVAVRALQRLLDEAGDRLIDAVDDEDLFVPVRDVVHDRMLESPALLERYRAVEGPAARRALDAGDTQRVADTRLLTDAGYEAALRIAQQLLELGAFDAAYRALLDVEFQALLEEIGRISSDTAVVDQNLIDRENVISAPPVPLPTFTDPGLIDISIRGFDTRPVAEGGDGDITFQLTFFGQPNAPQFVFDLQAFTAGGGFVRLFGQIPTELVDNSGSAVRADLSTGVTVVGDISNSGGTVSQFTLDNAQFVISVDEDFDVTPATNVGFFTSLEGAGPTQDLTFRGGTGIIPDEDDLDLRLRGLTRETLGLSLVDVTTASRADAALGAVTQAIDYTSSVRADLGSGLSRFEFATDLLRTTTDGQEAARSSLLDLDTAREVTRFVSLQIVQEAGISVFAQADSLSRELLVLYSQ